MIWLGSTPSSAQVKNPRRVTSVRATDAPEGSKVTVDSDSALSDYEAYRRGDRFYVKVPKAGLAASQPKLRGNGFEDVQVEKAGDGLVFSFRLKPGTAARVSQRMNRLDVIFSTPARSQNSSGATARLPNTAGGQARVPDGAGPVRSGTIRNTRNPRNAYEVREGASGEQTRAAGSNSRNSGVPTEQSGLATNQNATSTPRDGAASTNSNEAGAGTPNSSSGFQTPAQSAASTPPSTAPTSQTAASPGEFFNQWSALNLLLLLVGLLFLVGLALLVAKRKRQVTVKHWQPKAPRVLPKLPSEGSSSRSVNANNVSVAAGKPAAESAESWKPRVVPSMPVPAEVEQSITPTSFDDPQESASNQLTSPAPESNPKHSDPPVMPTEQSGSPSIETNPLFAAAPLSTPSMVDPEPPVAPVTPPKVPENKSNDLSGIQVFEVEAFREFIESRAAEQAEAIEAVKQTSTTLPASPIVSAPSATSSKTIDDFAAEEKRLLLQEQALRRAAEALDERRLVAENARKIAEAKAQLQAELKAGDLADAEEARIKIATEAREQAELEVRRTTEQEATRRLEEEEARRTLEAQVVNADAEAVSRAGEENRFRLEAETLRRAAEELARKRLAAEAARKAAEHETRVRVETEARRQAEEMPHIQSEEETREGLAEAGQRQVEEGMGRGVEEEANRFAAVEPGRRAEGERHERAAEVSRYAEEERLRLDRETLLQAAAELTRRRIEIEQARVRVEGEKRRLVEEGRKRPEAQQSAAEESERTAETDWPTVAEQKSAEDLARFAGQEQERMISELENVRKQAEERTRQRSEQEELIRAEIEQLRQAEEDHRRRLEAETRRRAEAETRLREAEARLAELRMCAAVEKETDKGTSEEKVVMDAPVFVVEPWFDGLEVAQSEKGAAQLAEESSIPADTLRKFYSPEPFERSAALTELALVGGDDAFRFITRAFDDQVADVRSAAAKALYDSQLDRAASFTRALRGSSPERRKNIGEALATSGLVNEAIDNLTGDSREKTYDAFSLLFLMAKAGAVEPLLNAIEEHGSIEVRLAVVKLLALSGQTEVVPEFRRLAVRGSLPSEVRSAVMEAIYQISSQSRESAPAVNR